MQFFGVWKQNDEELFGHPWKMTTYDLFDL